MANAAALQPRTLLKRSPERWIPVLLIAAVCVSFGSVVTHTFFPIDDPNTLVNNPRMNPPRLTGDGVLWYWTHQNMSLYAPIAYTVWAALAEATYVTTPDDSGAHIDPHIFDAASLLIHCTATLFAYGLLQRLLGRPWPAAAGALLYALHPLQVETVAWTSGMKDLLYGSLSLAAIYGYTCAVSDEDPSGSSGKIRLRPYLWATLAFFAAMLCKPTAMVTPLIAFAIDWGWFRRAPRKVARSLALWFALALPIALIARTVQQAPGVSLPPVWERPIVAGASYAFYLWKLIWPHRLAFEYGWRPIELIQQQWYWDVAAIPALLTTVLIVLRRRTRPLIVAATLFVIPILPVSGLILFEWLFFSVVADHYVYLAMAGPALAAAWAVRASIEQWPRATPIIAVLTGGLLLALGACSAVQMRHWRNEESALRWVLTVSPDSVTAHNALGRMLLQRADQVGPGKAQDELLAQAEREYLDATRAIATYRLSRQNLARMYSSQGRAQDAIGQIHELMRLSETGPPEVRQDYSSLLKEAGELAMSHHRYADAVLFYKALVNDKPHDFEVQAALRDADAMVRAATTRPATTSTTPPANINN